MNYGCSASPGNNSNTFNDGLSPGGEDTSSNGSDGNTNDEDQSSASSGSEQGNDGEPTSGGSSSAQNSTDSTSSGEGQENNEEGQEGEIYFDVPMPDGHMEGGHLGGDECKEVDLLFVVDDSGSMADEQIHLIEAFPEFARSMREQLTETDSYHIGVLSATNRIGHLIGKEKCGPFADGLGYLTEKDDLDSKFPCIANRGSDYYGEEVAPHATLESFDPALSIGGGPNEGFHRDDALLVVVILTDEEDDHATRHCGMDLPDYWESGSPGEPSDWFRQLVAHKGGDEKDIVVLSLIGPGPDSPLELCPPLAIGPEEEDCQGDQFSGAEPSPRLEAFTNMFTYGTVGRICEAGYGQFFSEAISVIESACNDFAE